MPGVQSLKAEAPACVCNMCGAQMKLLADFRGGLRPAARIFRCYNCNNVISERPIGQDARREGSFNGHRPMQPIRRSCTDCSTTMELFDRQPVDEEHDVLFFACPKCGKSSQVIIYSIPMPAKQEQPEPVAARPPFSDEPTKA